MHRTRLDGDVDDVAVLDARTRSKPADHRGLACALGLRRTDCALLTYVSRQLAHVLGERGRRADDEMRDDLRAKRLAEYDYPAQPLIVGCVGLEGRVLEVLGPDADHDLAADVGLERGAPRERPRPA